MMTENLNGGGRGGEEGPCGACKFLRRKCVKGCVFAPYFDADQGTTRFAAVHKVFGASNASKMLLRLPLHKRLDAVVTLSYEALARVRDPVYGSVGHLFSLQHQVMNLQAELAHVQACLSTFQHFSLEPSQQMHQPPFDTAHTNEFPMEPSNLDVVWDEEQLPQVGAENGGFQELSMQFVSRACSCPSRLSTFQAFSIETSQQMHQPPFDMAHNNEYPMEPSTLDVVWDVGQLPQGGTKENGEFQELAMQFVPRYLPVVKFPACTFG